jgi:hypothetical protein
MSAPHNIIDHIVLTPEACKAWREACQTGMAKLGEAGVHIPRDQIGTEEAYEQPDGSLVIQCREHWTQAN